MGIHYRTARHHHGWLRRGLAGHKIAVSHTHKKRANMDYRFENTIGGELIAKLREEMSEVLEVPNSWLPESYHVAGGSRSLASVEREMEKRQAEKAESIHAEKKASKAELIEVYRSQVERGEELFAA
jgi:malonyl CoA-acyl carrier protein transacylase